MALKFKNTEHGKLGYTIYGIAGVLLLFIIYHIYTINTLTNTISTNYASLSGQLQSTENELNEKIDSLQAQAEQQGQEIYQLEQETNTTKQTLTKQIKQVEQKSQQQLAQLEGKVSNLQVSSADFTAIIPDVIKSVVSVKTNVGQGSGVFVDNDGYVVTNAHVLNGANQDQITVTTESGRTYSARFVGSGDKMDIAVL